MDNIDLPLQCDITTSDVTLGTGHKNTNKIAVRLVNTANDSVQFSGLGADGTLSLTISFGTQAKDLVASAEDSSGIAVEPLEKWTPSYSSLPDKAEATWRFSLPEVVLPPRGGNTPYPHQLRMQHRSGESAINYKCNHNRLQ